MTNAGEPLSEGSCLYRQVRFRVRQQQRQVIACHCRQCRRMSGRYFAVTPSDWRNVELTETVGLAAGAFDLEPNFELAVHIWTDEAVGYYRITDDLPR